MLNQALEVYALGKDTQQLMSMPEPEPEPALDLSLSRNTASEMRRSGIYVRNNRSQKFL
jgi:hypothetical protein